MGRKKGLSNEETELFHHNRKSYSSNKFWRPAEKMTPTNIQLYILVFIITRENKSAVANNLSGRKFSLELFIQNHRHPLFHTIQIPMLSKFPVLCGVTIISLENNFLYLFPLFVVTQSITKTLKYPAKCFYRIACFCD